MNVLVVEDDPAVAMWVRRVFEDEGDAVSLAATADEAVSAAAAREFDLVLVDVGLPGRDGITVVAELRQSHPRTAILILSGRGHDDAVAAGLDAGADDYLTKPTSVTVLRARARAVVRRVAAPPADRDGAGADAPSTEHVVADQLTLGDLVLSRATRRARGPGGDAELTAKEFALLEYLMARPGEVVPRERLLGEVWGYTFDPGTNVVEVALSRLRRRLVEAGSHARVRTLRGMGVTLEAADRDEGA